MGDLINMQSGSVQLLLPQLSVQTHEALTESARRNGRTVHEEAEHIIKTHLAASGEDND